MLMGSPTHARRIVLGIAVLTAAIGLAGFAAPAPFTSLTPVQEGHLMGEASAYATQAGKTWRFGASCTNQENCIQSARPIQTAIDFSSTLPPDDSTIYVSGGLFSEDVRLDGLTGLTLHGGADGRPTTIAGTLAILNSSDISLAGLDCATSFL
jgi:hypothetical protein